MESGSWALFMEQSRYMYLLGWLRLTKAHVLTLHLPEFDIRTVTGRNFANDGSVDVAS